MNDEEIKEYHFHIYFYQNNPKSKELAMIIRSEFYKFVTEKLYVVALDKVSQQHQHDQSADVFQGPRGPHWSAHNWILRGVGAARVSRTSPVLVHVE